MLVVLDLLWGLGFLLYAPAYPILIGIGCHDEPSPPCGPDLVTIVLTVGISTLFGILFVAAAYGKLRGRSWSLPMGAFRYGASVASILVFGRATVNSLAFFWFVSVLLGHGASVLPLTEAFLITLAAIDSFAVWYLWKPHVLGYFGIVKTPPST